MNKNNMNRLSDSLQLLKTRIFIIAPVDIIQNLSCTSMQRNNLIQFNLQVFIDDTKYGYNIRKNWFNEREFVSGVAFELFLSIIYFTPRHS